MAKYGCIIHLLYNPTLQKCCHGFELLCSVLLKLNCEKEGNWYELPYRSLFCPLKSLYSLLVERLERGSKHFHVGFSVLISAIKIYQNVSYWRGGCLEKGGKDSLGTCQDKKSKPSDFQKFNLNLLLMLKQLLHCRNTEQR